MVSAIAQLLCWGTDNTQDARAENRGSLAIFIACYVARVRCAHAGEGL